MIVLIPAYEPGPALPALIAGLTGADAHLRLVVVDDGSGPRFANVFAEARTNGADVVTHLRNEGKGAALRTGFDHILKVCGGDDVVTADADGQHAADDILRVADGLHAEASAGTPPMVLGCRSFTGPVPARSRVGNKIARGVFRLAAGWNLSDTQTGLRGIPADMLPWMLDQTGDRFEYEQNVLLRCRRDGWATREVPIRTVYLEHNASSHFRPVVDSLRIGLPLLLFTLSSLLAFLVDTLALVLFIAVTGSLVPSIVAARLLSASVNFAINGRMVFRRSPGSGLTGKAVRYGILALLLLLSNVIWMAALTGLGIPLLAAKIATELVLFITSYGVQKRFVFPATVVSLPQALHRKAKGSVAVMGSDALTTTRRYS